MIIFGSEEAAVAVVARLIHHGQIRRGGQPYVEHCARVAQTVRYGFAHEPTDTVLYRQPVVVAAAWLHDAREDQPERWGQIYRELNGDVVQIVNTLTHPKDEPYPDYIARIIAAGSHAARIKWADLLDNFNDNPRDDARYRYLHALRAIRDAFTGAAWLVGDVRP